MKYKYGLIFICLVIFLFGIVSVCASDTNETTVANDNQKEISVVEEQEIYNIGATEENELSATPGTFTDLANDIANAGDELNLTRNYVFTDEDDTYKNGININKKINLNGNGFVINAKKANNVFKINFNNCVLKNIIFENCYSFSSGSTIYWIGDDGTLLNCTFRNCSNSIFLSEYSSKSGGTVYWIGSKGNLSNCKFINYHGSIITTNQYSINNCGGAIYWEGDYGCLHNSTFLNCSVQVQTNAPSSIYNSGGIIYWEGDYGQIGYSNFVNCSSLFDSHYYCYRCGGTVYWQGKNGCLYNSSFMNCSSFISSDSSPISKFIVNSGGGAIFWYGEYGRLLNSSFDNCYGHGKLFSGTQSWNEGGAVFWYGNNGTLSNCNFVNCSSAESGHCGAIFWYGNKGTLSSCNFDNCFSYYDYNYKNYGCGGGAVFWYGNEGILNNSNFINCHARDNGDGGAIYWYGDYGNLQKCNFTNCSHNGTDSTTGGAIYWRGDYGNISCCVFLGCKLINYDFSNGYSYCIAYGGAIYWEGNNGVLIRCDFINCSTFSSSNSKSTQSEYGSSSSLSQGGAIFWQGDNGFLFECNFNNCFTNCSRYSSSSNNGVCNSFGGSIFWQGKKGILLKSIFLNCSTFGSNISYGYLSTTSLNLGESIYWEGEDGKIEYCEYYNCSVYSKYKFDSYVLCNINNEKNISYGDNICIFPILSSNMSGIIDIYVDDIFQSKIESGTEFRLLNLDAGNHTIKLIFKGDDVFKFNETTKNFTILKANVTKPVINIFNKEKIYINLIFNQIDGSEILFNIKNNTYCKTIINNTLNFTFDNLQVGESYISTVTYLGDSNHNPFNATYILTIPLKYSYFNIGVENITVDDSFYVDYVITNNATGTISIYIDNAHVKTVSVGDNIELYNLKAGNHTIKVIYSGDDYYASCEQIANLNVEKYDSCCYFENDVPGKNVAIDLIFDDDATGYVNITFDKYIFYNQKLINGKTTFIIPDLVAGYHDYEINYTGDDRYNSISKHDWTYIWHNDAPITLNIPEIAWGDLFIINPVLPKAATGYIEILIDNVSMCNMSVGKSYRYNALIGGKHYLTVRYGGDDFFDENETTFEFTVNRFDSSIVVNDTYWANPSILLVFQLDQETTGLIKLTINNKQYSGEVNNGTCKINVNNLNIGSNNIVINYTGDNKYNPIYTVKEVNVLLKDPKLNLNINNIITGNNQVIRPTVISGATGSFKIYVDNTLKSTINVGSSYTLSKPAIGKHEIKIVYSGDSYFKSNNFTTTFRVFTVYPIESSDMQIIYGSNKYFKAKFYDEYGNPLSNKYVQFNVNGTDYPVKTNDDGIAVLNINLDVGTYNVTSISILDESKSNKLFIFHSVQAENMVIEYDGSYRFKASFLDENAEPLSKTGVIFILDGVTQPMVTTDVNGIAVLDKTLSLGSHTVTSINTITNENITNYIFVVSVINSIINIHELNDVNYGQNIELSIDVGENYLDAVIEIKITGDNGYNQIFSQKAISKITKQLGGLNAGKYTVDVKYQDNNNLFNLELNKTFSVFKIDPIMNVGISDVYVGGYATINVDVSNSNGLVSIKVGSRKYSEQLTNGKLVKVINGLAIGEYDVEIIFEGDNNYNPMIKTGSFKMYHTWNFNTNFGSVIVLEDKETYDEDIWGYTNYEVKIYNIIGDENDIIELFIDGNPVEILEKGYDTDDVGNGYWWIEFSPAFLSEGNHNWEIKYSNIPSFVVGTESGSFNAISWRVYGGNNFENKITKSITYVLNKDVNWKVKKVHYKDGMDIYLSTFTLNGKSFFIFTGLDVLTDSNMPIFEVFDSSEYFLYDGSYYKVNNGRIIDVIDVHDHITIEGVNYKFIGRFTNYENSYEVLNGKCYRYDGFYHEAIKDVDYKIINGKYYTMDNEEIEEYNSNQWNIIDGTKYYIEDNYYNAITPTTLGSDLALINGNYYSVVHKNLNIDIEDNKDNYYAIIDGNLYPVVKGVIGSPINLKQAINPTDIVISLLNDGTGDIKLPNDASGTIILSIAGKNYNFNVVNGIANVNMPDLTNGEYPYTITYSGDKKYASFSETGSITINKPVPHVDPAPTTLILKNIKVKRSAKKLALQATLKEGNSPLIGKKITFKFNGVKYKAKTNAKGIAKLTIKSKVLKKLKVGKKVKYQASYGKLVVKKSAKVKK